MITILPKLHLITHSLHAWDVPTLEANFKRDGIAHILSIPISLFPSQDFLVWHFERSGVYAVKSSYWIARKLEDSH